MTIPAGFVKLSSHAVRAEAPHLGRQLQHPGDGPQGVGDAAGAGGLLAQEPQVQGDPLIRGPARGAAGADRGKHYVRAVERLGAGTWWRGPRGSRRRAAAPRERGQDRLDGGQPAGVDVVQHQLPDQPRKGA